MLGSDDFWVHLNYFNYLSYRAHKSMPFGFEMCKKGLILLSYQVKFQNVTQNRLHLFLLMLQFSLDTLYKGIKILKHLFFSSHPHFFLTNTTVPSKKNEDDLKKKDVLGF